MGLLANLLIRIGADTKDLSAGLDKASRDVRKFGTELKDAGASLATGISLPLIGAGAAALNAAAKMEVTNVAFTTLLRSADAAKAHVEELKRFALITPFQFEDVVKASRIMQAYGFAVSDVIPKLRIMGDAVNAMGGRGDLLERVVRSIGEIGTRGKITGEQLRELSRAGIPALAAVAEKLGVTAAEAQAKIAAGSVDAKTALEAVLGYMDQRFAGGMEAQTKTLLGSWSNIKDKLLFTLAAIGDSILPWGKKFVNETLDPTLGKLKELAEAFGKLPAPVQNLTLAAGGLATVLPLAIFGLGTTITNSIVVGQALGKLGVIVADLGLAFGTRLFAALGAATNGMTALGTAGAAAAATGLVALGVAVADLIKGMWGLAEARSAAESASKTEADAVKRLETYLKSVGADIGEISRQYSHGEISYKQYYDGLVAAAKKHGEAVAATRATLGESLMDVGKALDSLGLKSTETLRKEYEAAKQANDIIQKSNEGMGVKASSLKRLQDAEEALNGILEKREKILGRAFSDTGLENAVMEEQYRRAVLQKDKLLKDIVDFRERVDQYGIRVFREDGKEDFAVLNLMDAEITSTFSRIQSESEKTSEIFNQMWKALVDGMNEATSGSVVLEQAMQLQQQSALAWVEFENYMGLPWKSSVDLLNSQMETAKIRVSEAKKEMSEFERDAHRAWNSMTNSIARNIVEWKGWKDSVINVGKDFAQGFLSIILKELLHPLESAFAKLAGQIGGWLGGLLGIGGGSGSSMTTLASGGGYVGASVIGSSSSSAAGAASKIASSGVMNTIGAIGSVGSMVSGIIGNFQFAGMNKTLDLIEKSARYLEIYVGGNGTECMFSFAKQAMQYLSFIHQGFYTAHMPAMAELIDAVKAGGGGGGGNRAAVTFNNCTFGPGVSGADIVSQMRLAGAQI